MPDTILLIDDDLKMGTVVASVLQHQGFTVLTATNGQDALRLFAQSNIDVVILDVKLPDVDGLELLRRLVGLKSHVPIIMISGFATVDRAVQATKSGAYDFLEKPIDPQRLLLVIRNALEKGQLEKDQQVLLADMMNRYGVIGASSALRNVYATAARVAKIDTPILIMGESGTGKELLAKVIDRLSGRSPFVCVNSAAIPQELIESELFGHRRGSFTGAISDRIGKFQAAHGGTLFLDEIGDMSSDTQAKILRALETKEISMVGTTEVLKVDVRLIAATNKNLEEEIRGRRFREDLYYRLRGVALHLPPLREYPEDIEPLAEFFIQNFCRERNISVKSLTPGAVSLLREQPWRGNVREIKHFAENLAIFTDGDAIDRLDVMRVIQSLLAASSSYPHSLTSESLSTNTKIFERNLIIEALKEAGGNITRAAAKLHLDRPTLSKKIKRFGLKGD